jgi:CheY-like chemotaxis protein
MALLNLAINARDAMPDGGRLTIATAPRALEGDAELEAGEYIEISVADVGAGMPPEVVSRALDPFFTTKGVGKGTGLGLSQVYGIARQGGGTVRIESRPGEGTTVRLLLPRTEAPISDEAAAMREEPPTDRWLATILVVDDDAEVRRFLIDSLDALGYWAIEAQDGPAGLEALGRFAPDLMLVDFAMPGMNGAELAQAVRAVRPDLPIVFASGYAEMAAIEDLAARWGRTSRCNAVHERTDDRAWRTFFCQRRSLHAPRAATGGARSRCGERGAGRRRAGAGRGHRRAGLEPQHHPA